MTEPQVTQPTAVNPAPCSEGYFISRAHTLAGLNVPLRELQKMLLKENKGCSQQLSEERCTTRSRAMRRCK